MPDSLLTESPSFRLTSSGFETIEAFIVQEDVLREQEATPVKLEMIAPDAAQLVSPYSLQPRCNYVLKLRTPSEEISVAFVVQWSVPLAGEGWASGCVFSEYLPQESIDALAKGEYVERRSDERMSSGMACAATMEGNSSPIQAVVRDYSRSGMCLAIAGDIAVGDKLRVQLPNETQPLFMRVRWSSLKSGDQLVGCRAIGETDFRSHVAMVQ